MQLLLQFYADYFETLLIFKSWSEKCILFGYNPKIFFSLFSQNELSHFSGQSEKILGVLLQFNAHSFETLQVLRAWSEDVHFVYI